jgi:hypothetical protein
VINRKDMLRYVCPDSDVVPSDRKIWCFLSYANGFNNLLDMDCISGISRLLLRDRHW